MSRPRKGSLEPAGTSPAGKPLFRFRLRLADGTKSQRFDVPEGMTEKQARTYVAGMQADEDVHRGILNAKLAAVRARMPVVPPPGHRDGEEGDRWYDSWETSRITKGLTSTSDNRAHYYKHVRPTLSGKHVRDWTPDDVRAIVRALDDKVRSGVISWKYAQNVYGTAKKMCGDAVSSKVDALRVRTDDPTTTVEGPDRGENKSKPFLYPSEFLRFAACEDVPLRWRLAVALAIYLFPRHGELKVLRWEDGAVDLEHGTIHIHRAWDRRARNVTSTKTGRSRRFNIEPALLPLLRELCNRAGGKGPILDLVSEAEMAVGLRRWLAKAGITRAELHTTTKTTKKLSWHDLRATGLTWMAVRGDEPLKIMQRAGHTNFQTTQIYVRTAEAIRDGFGAPFPALPLALFGPEDWASARQPVETLVGQPGLEPETNRLRVYCSTN
jgi:integrase